MTKPHKFDLSTSLNEDFDDEAAVEKRRVSMYSLAALKAASPIGSIYVNHSSFANAVMAMDRIFTLAPEMDIPQGMLLSGQPGVGKTSVFKYFLNSLPPSGLFAPGMGAIAIRCPKRTSTGFLIGSILSQLRYPFSTGSGKQLYARRRVVFDALKEKKTRLLFLDDADALLHSKTKIKADNYETEATDFLRELIDDCRMGLVFAIKIDPSALDNLDDGLASRISVRQSIEAFKPNAEWLGTMNGFVKQCKSFDISLISSNNIAKRLHSATNGNLRGFKRLLAEAILISFDSGKSELDESSFSRAFSLVYGDYAGRPNVFL